MHRTPVGWLAALVVALAAAPAPAQLIVASVFSASNQIQQYDINTGAVQAGGISGSVGSPGGLAFGPDGRLYVTSQLAQFSGGLYPDGIYVYGANGFDLVTFTPPVNGAPYSPAGLAFGPDGNLYVSRNVGFTDTQARGAVDRYTVTTTGGVLTINPAYVPVATGLIQPTGLLFNGADLYVSQFGDIYGGGGTTGSVLSLNTAAVTAPSVLVPQFSGGLTGPGGTTIGPDGNLYVADLLAGAIRKYKLNPDGSTTPLGDFANNAFTQNQFPSDLEFDGNGHLLVANLGPDFGQNNGNVTRFTYTTAADGSYVFASGEVIITGVSASQLAIVPVPEPGAVGGLAALGLAAAGWVRRRAARKG